MCVIASITAGVTDGGQNPTPIGDLEDDLIWLALSVDEGLVSRQNLIGDGRANLIRLEEMGRKALEESDRVARIDRAKLFQDISEAEIATTLKVLKALSDGIARPIKTPPDSRPIRNPAEIE